MDQEPGLLTQTLHLKALGCLKGPAYFSMTLLFFCFLFCYDYRHKGTIFPDHQQSKGSVLQGSTTVNPPAWPVPKLVLHSHLVHSTMKEGQREPFWDCVPCQMWNCSKSPPPLSGPSFLSHTAQKSPQPSKQTMQSSFLPWNPLERKVISLCPRPV